MRRTLARNVARMCSVASFILTAASPGLTADDLRDPAHPGLNRTKPPVDGSIGPHDAIRLGGELLSEDYRITDRRITDARYLPSEKIQVRKERRLKGEKYLPTEEVRHEAREEKAAVTIEEQTKKKKAETILQF